MSPGASYTVEIGVPAGKRLVLEQASASTSISNSVGAVASLVVKTTSGGTQSSAHIPMQYIGEGPNSGNYFVATQPLHMYADAGTSVTVMAWRSRDMNHAYTGSHVAEVNLTGYFVNVP